MKILITGGCGFIGSALVRRLLASAEMSVVNIDKLTYAATPQAIGQVPSDGRYVLEPHDICDRPAIDAILARHQPEAIIHLAAESHVDRSIDAPADFIQTNIIGTYTLLEAMRTYMEHLSGSACERFRFVHVSTDEVFGDLTPEDAPFDEQSPYRPNSPYSASKAASDHLVRAWHATYGLPTVTTNCSNNYGPWQAPEKLIPVVITKLVEGQRVPVYGDGMNIRDWLHVEDHAEALLCILEQASPGSRYNIGGNCEVTNIDLVRQICNIMDARMSAKMPHERHIEFVTDRKGHDRRYAINSGRLATELGWKTKHNLREGLEQTVDWYLDNADWCRQAMVRVA